MQPIIEFQGVSKCYSVGTGGRSLRNALADLPLRLIRRNKPAPAGLWALRDVTFQVSPGESLGILGHNGAGKTTLLKLLSEITYPTQGAVRVRGRLGTLIELGAGFHPEMTGRENVYLNGVILGMTRAEVNRRFESIVDFAGIGRFIDTPVKRYSSGMYVRLAFAVAVHVNPAILLIDEVLAVGDIGFRARCYRRMAELRKNGTTIVLVSHDVYAIRDTCDRALLIWEGQLQADGCPDSVISAYLARMQSIGTEPTTHCNLTIDPTGAMSFIKPETAAARITSVALKSAAGHRVEAVASGQKLYIEIGYSAHEEIEQPIFRIDFYRSDGLYTGFSTAYDHTSLSAITGDGTMCLCINNLFVPPDIYSISVVIADTYEYNLLDTHHRAYPLRVLRASDSRGEVPLPHSWRLDSQPHLRVDDRPDA
jgi:lipopolysaccharide transport system ATP-binding protein